MDFTKIILAGKDTALDSLMNFINFLTQSWGNFIY